MPAKFGFDEYERNIVDLLTADGGTGLQAVTNLSRILDSESLAVIDRTSRQAVGAGKYDVADSMLLRTERAAEMVGADAIHAWARLGRGLLAVGQRDQARATALIPNALEQLDAAALPLDRSVVTAYIEGADWLCENLIHEKRLAEAREQLARMLRHAQASRVADIEARIVLKLLWMSLNVGDLESSETHALALVDRLWKSLLSGPDTRTATFELLRKAVSTLYAEGEAKYDAVRRIGHSLVTEGGENGGTLLALATAAFSQDDFADSLTCFNRLLEAPEKLLPGYDVWRLHHRQAICLIRLERPQEALDAIGRAMAIEPVDPYVRFAAAELLESTGDHARSVEEYTTTVVLAEARMAASPADAGKRPKPRSSKEYESSTPLEDLRDFALIRKGLVLHRSGDRAAALAAMERLLAVADEISQASALMTLAEWAHDDKRQVEAVAFLERALSLRSGRSDEVSFRLAQLLIELGSYERAIEVMAPFCHKSCAPERCIKMLDLIPTTWTKYQLVLKHRGHAMTEAGWARQGFAELSRAVSANTSDAEALVMRALARLTLGIQNDQEAWNRSRSMQHIRESLDDLYAARRLTPGDKEILRIIQWLVERAASNPEMFEIFSAGGSPEGDLFAAFPYLKSAFELSWRANDLAANHRFAEAAQLWLEAQGAHDAAGFRILGGRVSIRLADVHIRLLELDAVETHLARAEQLPFLVDVPLSVDVVAQYEQMVAGRGRFELPTMGREVEYAWIYDHVRYDFALLQFVTASYRHRIGDLEGALESVEIVAPLLKELSENFGSFFGMEEVLWVIAIERDAGRYEDALRLLDALQTSPQAKSRLFDLLYMRGLLHDAQGDSLHAMEAYEKALAAAGTKSAGVGKLPYVQYAASLLNAGRPADALLVLQQVDVERDAFTDRDRLVHDVAAAWIYAENGCLPEAIAAVERAIPMVEAKRAEIGDPRSRRSWQGQHHNLFSIAVRVYVESGNLRRAWEVIELSRARTLLDDLTGREAESAEHHVLITELETIDKAIRLLDRAIADAATTGGDRTLRAETRASLAAVLAHGFKDIVDSEPFVQGKLADVRKQLVVRQTQAHAQERAARERGSRPIAALPKFAEIVELLKEEVH